MLFGKLSHVHGLARGEVDTMVEIQVFSSDIHYLLNTRASKREMFEEELFRDNLSCLLL